MVTPEQTQIGDRTRGPLWHEAFGDLPEASQDRVCALGVHKHRRPLWSERGPSPKFVQPSCTATTDRIQVGEMLLHEAVEAYKKEGPKFVQHLVAKLKARVKDS